MIRDGDKLKIRIPSITFPPNSPDLSKVIEADKAAKNEWVLQRLAQILNKYSSYDFRIEGHANQEYWQNPARAAREEKEELGPLSLARAEAVKNALVAPGIEGGADFRGRTGRHRPGSALRGSGKPLEEPQGGVHPAEEVVGGARARTMSRRAGRGLLAAGAAVVVLAVGLTVILYALNSPSPGIPAEGKIFAVRPGETLGGIAARLQQEGLVRSAAVPAGPWPA